MTVLDHYCARCGARGKAVCITIHGRTRSPGRPTSPHMARIHAERVASDPRQRSLDSVDAAAVVEASALAWAGAEVVPDDVERAVAFAL